MINADAMIETQKFKKFAETADTQERRIELCVKYLKSKGIEISSNWNINPPREVYIGPGNVNKIESIHKMDLMVLDTLKDPMAAVILQEAKTCIAQNIVDMLVKGDYIKYETFRDMDAYQTIIRGKMLVYKEESE